MSVDLLNRYIDAWLRADATSVMSIQREANEAMVAFNRIRARIDLLARDCGLTI